MIARSSALLRALRGPLLLITVGLLFVADYFGSVPFYRTWPVLLIVYGFLKLLERMVAPREGAGAPAGGTL